MARTRMTSSSCLAFAVLTLLVAFFFAASVQAVDIDVLPLRLDNPTPNGSGVKFFRLLADPADTDASALNHFKVVSQSTSPTGQAFKLWDSVNNNCNGVVLANGDSVPEDGKVCFWADTTGAATEFESFLTYVAVDDGEQAGATSQKVVVVTYNVQTCPSIPDLGESGFAMVPPSPTVSITLSGLEIKFEVTASYMRNQTTWLMDFFSFDSAAGQDTADGTGRTCANHVASNFGADFSQWWDSQPRANFNSSVDSSITNALESALFPNYLTTGTKWTVTNIGCDLVKFTATIPTVNLISNGPADCTAPGATTPAATASGLNYTANLYVFALRPKDVTDPSAGYYKATFMYPFSFRLQQTVTDLTTISSKWAFSVAVENLVITRGTSLILQLETTISAPSVNSPDMPLANFRMAAGFPNEDNRVAAAKQPTLSRLSDNAHCGASDTVACVIVWQVVLDELTQVEAGGSMSEYNQQYIGAYSFLWTTTDGDELAAHLIIDAVAANSTDVGQIDVPSVIKFFRSQEDMTETGTAGLDTTTFSSGEQVWVRHDFLVNPADVAVYEFTLQRAWVCWTSVSDFTPLVTDANTGCSADIAGVMEARLGQRVLLYNVSETTNAGGIVDVTFPAGSTQKSRVWGFNLVAPTAAAWTGESVHNGFGINALPLIFNADITDYYFHLVSQVSQAPLKRGLREVHSIVTRSSNNGWRRRANVAEGSSGTLLSGITVLSDSPSSASRLGASWLGLFN